MNLPLYEQPIGRQLIRIYSARKSNLGFGNTMDVHKLRYNKLKQK